MLSRDLTSKRTEQDLVTQENIFTRRSSTHLTPWLLEKLLASKNFLAKVKSFVIIIIIMICIGNIYLLSTLLRCSQEGNFNFHNVDMVKPSVTYSIIITCTSIALDFDVFITIFSKVSFVRRFTRGNKLHLIISTKSISTI